MGLRYGWYKIDLTNNIIMYYILNMNMNIVNYSGFKQTINTYISNYKRQKKKIWDAVHNRNIQLWEPHIEQTHIQYEFENKHKEFIREQHLGVLWELKYQERMNNIIQKRFYNKIYIWRTILIQINKRKFHDDICVNVIKFLIY
jgi:hypothetical protein